MKCGGYGSSCPGYYYVLSSYTPVFKISDISTHRIYKLKLNLCFSLSLIYPSENTGK